MLCVTRMNSTWKQPRHDRVPGLHRDKLGLGIKVVLPKLLLHEAEGELCAVDGDLELFEEERERADVVLVRVRKQNGADLVAVLEEIGKVRDHDVHAEHLGIREHESRVDHDDVVAVFEHGHVETDLADAAQRDDRERRPVQGRLYWNVGCLCHGYHAPGVR